MRLLIGMAAVIAFLGAGCRKAPALPPSSPESLTAPATNAPEAPFAPDPLADDLDAAIEDLNAIE